MRSTTGTQDTALAANVRGEFVQIEVQNADGTWIDLTNLAGFDWVLRWSVSWGVDQPIPEARVSLVRDRSDANRSLAPLRSDSPLNVDDSAAYAPILDGGRGFRINVAVMAWGSTPGPSDWVRLFTGEIDEVDSGQPEVEVVARSAIGVQLMDRFIETENVYGSGAGTAMETVIQSILTDWTDDPVSLYTPASPGFNIVSTPFKGISVLDALNRIVALIGWTARERWDDGTSQFRLTLEDPDRSKTTPDHTLGPEDYWDVETLRIGRNEVRNAIRLTYLDSATGEIDFVTAEDATSIARYGRKPLLITEAAGSSINTEAEAQAMADAALADLKDPVAEQRVDNRLFWPAQLGDLYTWTANGVHYNVDQDLAVTRIEHHGEAGLCGTRLDVRGTPMGFNRYWRAGRAPADLDLSAVVRAKWVPIPANVYKIEVEYDLGADVAWLDVVYRPTDAWGFGTAERDFGVAASGRGVVRLDPTSLVVFTSDVTDRVEVEITPRTADGGVAGPTVYTQTEIFAEAGAGVRAEASSGGAVLLSDRFVAGTGVTIAPRGSDDRIEISATGGGGGITNIADADDTAISAPADGEALLFDSGDWVNRDLAASDIQSGIFGLARGGIGRSSVTAGNLVVGAGSSAMTELAPGTAGGFVRSNGSAWVRSTIQASDLPSHSHSTSDLTSGTLGVARGGTGAASWSVGFVLLGNGSSAFGTLGPGAAGTFIRSDGASWSAAVISASDLPGHTHTAAQVVSGTFVDSLIPSLAASKITSGTFAVARIPSLPASQITSGTFSVARGGTGAATWTAQALLVGNGASAFGTITPGANGTYLRSNGTAWSAATIVAADIPGLPASIITSGTFADARIPNLAASKTTSGTFDIARIPSIPVSSLSPGILASGTWTWRGSDGSAAAPGLSFNSDTNSGIYRVGENIIGHATAGVLRAQIDTSGFKVVSGSTGSPSIAGLSFTTSGVYWASGVVGISVSGTSRLRATTSGAAVTGTITATGDVQSSVSDARLKTEIVPIDRALERVGRLRGVYHRYTDEALDRWPELTSARRAALIAQDVAEVLPEASIPFAGDERYLNYLPDMVIPLLVEGMKELRDENERLWDEIESLRARRAA